MDYLPVSLKLTGKRVLLVGAGAVATRKARLLLRAGAVLYVVAPHMEDTLRGLLSDDCRWRAGEYRSEDLDGVSIVVAATASAAVNRAVSADAQHRALPVNVVDAPELCTFIFPAIVDRDPVLISVSSGGSSPVLTRILRRKIESMIPGAYGRLGVFAGKLRDRVKDSIVDPSRRRYFWEQVLEGAVAEQVMAGREEAAQRMVDDMLEGGVTVQGEVYLVGAGPGDPDLLTFKAARLLQGADVVLYDALVSDEVLDLARRDAERIYVGKRRADHALPQEDINRLLLELARSGKRVIRLKGGDPFIFGRGGEEIELLAREGIPFQVVPGITAASGAACYAGIPLTHRDYAQSVRFVAGYLKGDRVDHDWSLLQNPSETLVFYMGLVGLPVICEELVSHGRSPDTPVALVERATSGTQRVLTGTLATMVEVVAAAGAEAPTIIIVGDVVRLHGDLAWFGAARS